MTTYPDLFAALARPFQGAEAKARTQAGRQFHYSTARTAMNRLDEVLGPEHWWDEYVPQEHSVLCRLTIRLPSGETLTKADAGGYAGMSDEGDDDKSGYSDAFKRAAVKFGVARYLYRDGVPDFASGECEAPKASEPHSEGKPEPRPAPPANPPAAGYRLPSFQMPRAGKAVYAWAKSMEQHFKVDVVRELREFGKSRGYGENLVEWTDGQAEHACGMAVLFLAALEDYKGEFEGKVDLDQLRRAADAAEHHKGEHDALRVKIAQAIDGAIQARTGGQPNNDARRRLLDVISASSVNASGTKGEVLQGRLTDCHDGVWLHAMAEFAEREFRSTQSEAFA